MTDATARRAAGSPRRLFRRRHWVPKPAPVWIYAAAIAALVCASALLLATYGRPLGCGCGETRLWSSAAGGPESSRHVTDWYSALHLTHGMIAYAVMWTTSRRWPFGWMLVAGMAMAAGWEAVENTPWLVERLAAAGPASGYAGDSIVNSAADMAFAAIGFTFSRWAGLAASLGLAISIEAAVGWAIGDGLVIGTLTLFGFGHG